MIVSDMVMTPAEMTHLISHLEYHHTAICAGYISRRENALVHVDKYSGRYGAGYKVYSPRYDTTRFCDVSYYIRPEND